MPELEVSGPEAEAARRLYCGSIGAEFMHIPDRERRLWIQERMEAEAPEPDRARILELLIKAEVFEQVLQTRYLGTKRYSLEGEAALLPLLDAILNAAAEQGAEKAMLAMSHRGRLNVMVNIVGRTAAEVFARFEDVDPRSILGGGDVKYHMGATGDFHCRRTAAKLRCIWFRTPAISKRSIRWSWAARARSRCGAGQEGRRQVIRHHDARRRGVRRTGNLGRDAEYGGSAGLHGRRIGAHHRQQSDRLHDRSRGTPALLAFHPIWPSGCPIPIFHVNAEDPEAVVRVGRMALDYRYAFGTPVVVDLIGYRRHGHSEVDDPTITQPLRYRKIEAHPPDSGKSTRKRSALDARADRRARARRARCGAKASRGTREESADAPAAALLGRVSAAGATTLRSKSIRPFRRKNLAAVGRIACEAIREGFHIHPKVQKLLEQRLEMARGKRALDFGMAEALAFGSLLKQGVPVRLTGQDTRRGTFNQRHAALIDIETEEEYVPLEHIGPDQAWCEIYNSPLSEASVLGFEYGFSRDYPEALVLWEAQFGDFANGAQIIIDQFIAASEDKWNLLSGVVMLLPHGYEGQGPEHSSARIERYLQLAARDNIQICQPSTAAQYFHLLRRQALRTWRKPLIVFTPKSMLRNPGRIVRARGSHDRPIPAGHPGSRRWLGHALAAVHRKNRSRTPSRAETTQRHLNRHRVSSNSSILSRKRSSPRRWTGIGTRENSSGCRKSRGTWAPSPLCCRGSNGWRADAPCCRSSARQAPARPRDRTRRTSWSRRRCSRWPLELRPRNRARPAVGRRWKEASSAKRESG